MKKSLSLALLGAATAGGAWAQSTSSVTLFGVTDAYVRYVKTGSASTTQLGSGGESTSRFGFRGTEDLGGGLKAGFWLESQVGVDTGSVGATSFGVNRFFHRRSTVSLSGRWGEVRAGRDLVPTWTAVSNFDVFGTVGVGTGTNLYNDAAAFGAQHRVRADNMVAYHLPSGLGGFYGSVAASAGEGSAAGKYWGARLGYASGPVNVTIAHGNSDSVTAPNQKVTVVSGSYDFSVVKLNGTVLQSKLDSARHRFASLNASAPVGAGVIKVGYARATGDGVLGTTDYRGNKADQLSLGYVHHLSKRTAVYTTVSYLKNRGNARYAVASITNASTAAGDRSRGIDVGIRHSF